jgi:cell division septation protein DedD
VKEPVAPVREPEPVKPKEVTKPESETGGPRAPEPGDAQNPEPGATYLQLTATRKADCASYVDVLRKKGFPAIYARVPDKEDLYRVLVGPLKDAAAVNKTRADLDEAGFPGSKSIRKTF